MCHRCPSSGADPFEKKALTMDGVDANATPQRQTGGQEWEKDPRTRSRFMQYAEAYMEWVFDEYGFNVLTRDMINFRDSGRMTSLLGRCDMKGPYEIQIVVSWDAYLKRGYEWERLRNTVKHELAHASNYAEYGYGGHGPTFIEEAQRLDVDKISRYDEPDPRYFVVCSNCGLTLWRQKRSKLVKAAENNRRMAPCNKCGINNWDVLHEAPAKVHPVWSQKNPHN